MLSPPFLREIVPCDEWMRLALIRDGAESKREIVGKLSLQWFGTLRG
jgi:hypothetical protein